MNADTSTLFGATLALALLVGVVFLALLRFRAAAQSTRRLAEAGSDAPPVLSAAMYDTLSALKAREQAMSARAAASEELSAQVFDSLSAGLIVVSADGTVRVVNPAARRMLGLTHDVTGAKLGDVLADVRPLAEVIDGGLASGHPIVRRTVHVEHGDWSWHFGVTVSPLGAPELHQGAICLFSDLTTVVDLEQQLQLKEALARLGELAAGIAHEFRNGLATIHGYGRLIDPHAVPPQYKPYVEGIRQETDALRQVVTKFLEFARPESATFFPVDLEAVVRRAADDLSHELPAGTLVQLEGDFGMIQGDEVLLRQLFGNLIRNAVEACDLAKVVPLITIGAHPDASGRLAVVAVDDNGPGIAAVDRARIFQPFFTTRSRGSGLGLSIVQKIALHHNGRVVVDAAPGGGARVQVTLPLAG